MVNTEQYILLCTWVTYVQCRQHIECSKVNCISGIHWWIIDEHIFIRNKKTFFFEFMHFLNIRLQYRYLDKNVFRCSVCTHLMNVYTLILRMPLNNKKTHNSYWWRIDSIARPFEGHYLISILLSYFIFRSGSMLTLYSVPIVHDELLSRILSQWLSCLDISGDVYFSQITNA